MLNLCWNHDNALTGAALGSGSGLTGQGRSFVRECQRLGVAVDLSHASERAFWDALEEAEKPVVASHSNSYALCPAPRNLTDGQFSALAKRGGGAGVNLYPPFLTGGRAAGLDAAVRHIERFLAIGGEGSVFIGADFDGIDCRPEGVDGAQDMYKLYEALLRRNYPERLVRAILTRDLVYTGENAMNIQIYGKNKCFDTKKAERYLRSGALNTSISTCPLRHGPPRAGERSRRRRPGRPCRPEGPGRRPDKVPSRRRRTF